MVPIFDEIIASVLRTLGDHAVVVILRPECLRQDLGVVPQSHRSYDAVMGTGTLRQLRQVDQHHCAGIQPPRRPRQIAAVCLPVELPAQIRAVVLIVQHRIHDPLHPRPVAAALFFIRMKEEPVHGQLPVPDSHRRDLRIVVQQLCGFPKDGGQPLHRLIPGLLCVALCKGIAAPAVHKQKFRRMIQLLLQAVDVDGHQSRLALRQLGIHLCPGDGRRIEKQAEEWDLHHPEPQQDPVFDGDGRLAFFAHSNCILFRWKDSAPIRFALLPYLHGTTSGIWNGVKTIISR